MNVHVAILRAINVGGTGKLPMADLRRICEEIGFGAVRTYIQSGNVVFTSRLDAAGARTALAMGLKEHFGKEMGVFLRGAAEMRRLVEQNPFSDKPGDKVAVILLDDAPTEAELAGIAPPGGEQVAPGPASVYVFHPDGMGRSKLKLPFAAKGTSRNMNTIARLADMAAETDR